MGVGIRLLKPLEAPFITHLKAAQCTIKHGAVILNLSFRRSVNRDVGRVTPENDIAPRGPAYSVLLVIHLCRAKGVVKHKECEGDSSKHPTYNLTLQTRNLNRLLERFTVLMKLEILCHTSVAIGQEIISQVLPHLRILKIFSLVHHTRPISL